MLGVGGEHNTTIEVMKTCGPFQTHNWGKLPDTELHGSDLYYCTQMLFDSGGSQMILLPWRLYPSSWGNDMTEMSLSKYTFFFQTQADTQ